MEPSNSQSSTTILLVICVVALGTIGAGWFLLDSEPEPVEVRSASNDARDQDQALEEDSLAAEAELTPAVTVSDVPLADPAPTPVPEAQPEPEPEQVAQVDAQPSIESDLRKARMAAEAEIFVEPLSQSALYFYGRVLDAAPGHEVASAELDAVLGQLAVTASSLLSAQNYAAAYELSTHVARVRPDHALVNDVQQTIDQLAGDLVTEAMQAAETGEAEQAGDLLDQAQALPGRNARYFQAVRETVGGLVETQAAAEAERIETAQATAARETRSWMEKVRGAIADGRLIAPADNCAVQFVSERGSDDEIARQLRQEIHAALISDATSRIESGQLESAEPLLSAARNVEGATDEIEALESALETAFIERESARVVPTTELVRRNAVAAKYPTRAQERGISGWVEVLFTVTATGETADITIANSEPGRIFDQTAIDAVQQWLFEPQQFRGRPISQRSKARLVFTLD